MAESRVLRNVNVLGELTLPIADSPRTDTPAAGVVDLYHDGGGLAIQIYDALHGTAAWHTFSAEQHKDTQLTAAQVNALMGTNIELVPAPAATAAIFPIRVHLFNAHGGTDFVQPAGSDHLAIRYSATTEIAELGSEAQCTALLEAAADAALTVPITSAYVPIAGTAIDLDNNGASEYTTGDGTLSVRVYYHVVPMAAFT